MKRVELRTDSGDFVAMVDVPPFPSRYDPCVVIWGDRVFVLDDEISGAYIEAFAVTSLTPSPGFPKPPPNTPPPVDMNARTTTRGGDPNVPRKVDPTTGLQDDYVVLKPEERAKGFVRPVRETYRHVGIRPKHPLRDLTAAEKEQYKGSGYVKYEEYPESEKPVCGRFWTARELRSGCGSTTTMTRSIAETYARAPEFYGATYCATCHDHFPVGAKGEFVWEGTDERVGT